MVAIRAQSPWLEQMLEVAFSRRMCCSRVARVRTKPRRPVQVEGLADQPSGHGAQILLAGGEKAELRPAEGNGDAEALPLPDGDVGAELARGLEQAQGDRLLGDR